MDIKRRFRTVKAVAAVTYKEWAAYRTHSMVSIFVGPAVYLVQYSIWRAVYSGGAVFGGMTLQNILAYSAVVATISYLTMDFADWNLQMLIHSGKYVTFALRPVHHRFFALSQKIGHRILGMLFEYIPVLLIFIFLFRVDMLPASFLWTALSVALAFLMNFYINYCIGLSGFWLTKTGGLRGVMGLLTGILSGAAIPLTFFPQALQKIFFFLPFQFLSYAPARVYIGNYTLGEYNMPIQAVVAVQAVYVIVVGLLSEVLYRLGNRKYTGVGV